MRPVFLKAISIALATIGAEAGSIQLPGLTVPPSTAADRDAVVSMFNESYSSYRKYAFGHDVVAQTSEQPVPMDVSGLNGWGASIIDAMSTMYIMGLTDLFDESLSFAQDIDFTESKTADTVNVFESTICYIGGLISAYELSGKQHFFLVQNAQRLADRLSLAWSQGNIIPFNQVNFTASAPVKETSSIAAAGTLTLEWSRLSEYTGNDTYRKLAEGSVRKIIDNPMPLPGLPGKSVDPTTGSPADNYVTWGGGSDSYFEYLIKYAWLSNTTDSTFADSWLTAVDSSIKTLVKTSTVGNHVYLAELDDDRQIRHVGSQYACSCAGNWLLGGKLANNDTIVDYALQLNDACWSTYEGVATGIGPEMFGYISADGNFTGSESPSKDQLAFYNKNGFYIIASDYAQYAGVLESNFYAWRVTGNTTYLQRAQSAVASFNKYLYTPLGFVGLDDVNNATSAKINVTESFWFAEVLKYLYLTFDDPNHINLDNYVFNTEAHPLMAPQAPTSSGSTIQTPTSSGSTTQAPTLSSGSGSSNTSAIVGGVVGAIAILVFIIGWGFYLQRRRHMNNEAKMTMTEDAMIVSPWIPDPSGPSQTSTSRETHSLSDPTTGIFRPEMQETPLAPDVTSQVVSAPPSPTLSTSPPPYDTLSNVPARPLTSSVNRPRPGLVVRRLRRK